MFSGGACVLHILNLTRNANKRNIANRKCTMQRYYVTCTTCNQRTTFFLSEADGFVD